jgi:hypothetical protein
LTAGNLAFWWLAGNPRNTDRAGRHNPGDNEKCMGRSWPVLNLPKWVGIFERVYFGYGWFLSFTLHSVALVGFASTGNIRP